MEKVNHDIQEEKTEWTVSDAENLYRMNFWGDPYFSVNDKGNVTVRPVTDDPITIDIHEVARQLREEGVAFPVLIRFQDLLRSRVVLINRAFQRAIDEFEYRNVYRGVYPIKVNQLREVVQEILEAGEPYGFGLECGSKAELVAALPHMTDDNTLLICNGYKDDSMMGLILIGQQLGKNIIPILEKYEELDGLLRMANQLGVTPQFGVRVRVSASGSGKWAASAGDNSKFGISTPELLTLVQELETRNLTGAFKLVHFHLGSQIADIQKLKQAIKEITRLYARLRQRGINVEYVDVGGGLGVNYQASDMTSEGINYTLQEYVNSVVYAIKEVCDDEAVPHPIIVSESGRAVTAHHSVLLVEVLGAYGKSDADVDAAMPTDPHEVVTELQKLLASIREKTNGQMRLPQLVEIYHDAVEKREEADMLFGFGYLSLEQKAVAEQLYWSVCKAINKRVHGLNPEWLPKDLTGLDEVLVDQYLCDFSVFQSMLDYWAIGQLFPVMPIHRLNEQPTRRAVLGDLTCDSDGKVDRFVSPDCKQRFIEVHPLKENHPYYLGFFLMGAYQDIMGDIHNLFGRVTEVHVYADAEEPGNYFTEKIIQGTTIEEILALVQYFPNDLQRRMEQLIQQRIREGRIRPSAGVRLLEQYRKAFHEYTYLTSTDRLYRKA